MTSPQGVFSAVQDVMFRPQGQRQIRIAEIFQSRQGEGLLTGTESVFIRTSGCNLRCWFCDTPYASWSVEGEHLTVEEILARVRGFSARHVVVTGGEPMLFPDLVELTRCLDREGYHITIETSGTRYLPAVCHLLSISPKLSNSTPSPREHPRWAVAHERRRHCPAVVKQLIQGYSYQIKFVIDTENDLDEVESYLNEVPEIDRSRVLLMPQGIDQKILEEKARWLEPLCQQHGFRFCPRKQIEWYGPVRGK